MNDYKFKVVTDKLACGNDPLYITKYDILINLSFSSMPNQNAITFSLPSNELMEHEYIIYNNRVLEILNVIKSAISMNKSVYVFGNINNVLLVIGFYYINSGVINGIIEILDTLFFSDEDIKWEMDNSKKLEQLKFKDHKTYESLLATKPKRQLTLNSYKNIITNYLSNKLIA